MNSNNVFKFSGLGAVTKIFEYLCEVSMSEVYSVTIAVQFSVSIASGTCMRQLTLQVQTRLKHTTMHVGTIMLFKVNPYPKATAPAIATPKAADFPLPRAAVSATVLRKVFSEIASRKVMTALA